MQVWREEGKQRDLKHLVKYQGKKEKKKCCKCTDSRRSLGRSFDTTTTSFSAKVMGTPSSSTNQAERKGSRRSFGVKEGGGGEGIRNK